MKKKNKYEDEIYSKSIINFATMLSAVALALSVATFIIKVLLGK